MTRVCTLRQFFGGWVGVFLAVLFSTLDSTAQSPGEAKILWSAEWSPDGAQFAVGGIRTLSVFDSESYEKKILVPKAENALFTVTSVSWHPSRKVLAVTGQDGGVNGIYDVVSGEVTPLRTNHGRGVSWNSAGGTLATSSPGDGHLRIWSSEGDLLHDIPRFKKALGLTGVAWSPSGDRK